MAQILQHRRDTTAGLQNESGSIGEIIIDTTKNTVVVMDGATAGGFPLAKESDIPVRVSDLQNDAGYITAASVFSGSYNDLTNTPTLFSGSYNDLTNTPALFSGAYTDLSGKPDLSIYQLANTAFNGTYSALTGKPTLFSGAYADLTDKPSLFSGSYTDLTSKPDLSVYQLANSAFSGAYDDLTGAPNLSTYQLTVDAFNGNYNDLANLPTIPTDVSDLTDIGGLLDTLVLTTDIPVQGTFPVGTASAISVTNSPNPNWTNGTGVFANGINFGVAVDGSGNATVSSISDGGTGHFVGETFGPVPGTAFGGTSPADDMYFEVTAIDPGSVTALDLTKQIQILDADILAGVYGLADGAEGQVMYFVPSSGVNAGIYVLVANARTYNGIDGVEDVQNYSWTPFSGETLAPTTIAMAIFANGAWCLRGGATD